MHYGRPRYHILYIKLITIIWDITFLSQENNCNFYRGTASSERQFPYYIIAKKVPVNAVLIGMVFLKRFLRHFVGEGPVNPGLVKDDGRNGAERHGKHDFKGQGAG